MVKFFLAAVLLLFVPPLFSLNLRALETNTITTNISDEHNTSSNSNNNSNLSKIYADIIISDEHNISSNSNNNSNLSKIYTDIITSDEHNSNNNSNLSKIYADIIISDEHNISSNSNNNSNSANNSSSFTSNLIKPVISKRLEGSYELWEIKFFGNSFFSSLDLLNYLVSKPTSLSFPHKILRTLYNQTKANGTIPNHFLSQLEVSTKHFEKEYQYFNIESAEIDSSMLQNLYNANGFHLVKVSFAFGFDTTTRKNTLVFSIEENQRFRISSLDYNGLEDLSPDAKSRISRSRSVKVGDHFDEAKLETEINSINSAILNSGYMYSKVRWDNFYPDVIMDTAKHTDSIVCVWDAGKKIKFGKVIFDDNTNGQNIVAGSTKRKMILFKEGDEYTRWRINRSIENLLSMGTFESVSIDTLEREYAEDENIRDFVVRTNYRKLKDWDVGLFVDQTQVDNLFNAGFNGSIRHHNLFGSAQSGRLFFDFSLKDLNYFLSTFNFPDYQVKVGGTYSQPLLWMLNTTRIGLSTGLIFSLETVGDFLKIATVSFPIRFPIKLSRSTYFSSMQIELNFERQAPINFYSAITSAFEEAKTKLDSNNTLQIYTFYNNINNYLNEPETHIFTSNILSVFLIGDSRNHPFSPTTGDYTYLAFDGLNIFLSHPTIAGGAKYFRAQILHNRYWQLSRVLVAAAKSKLGMTYLMNEANAFVPFDRQFFAGGANSVRAWQARTLRYYTPSEEATNTDFAINYVGSRSVIEGSFELRRKLSDIPGASESFKWIMNDLGISLFVDIGNAFSWYREDGAVNSTSVKITDYFTKLAVGTGFGFHYETPVGPIRLDFATPVYDPIHIKKPFGSLTLNFGIGHSF